MLPLVGFAAEAAGQSAIFAVIEALLSKLGRGAMKTVGAQALRKVPGFASRIPAASLSAAGKDALLGAIKGGAVLGVGDTAFSTMLGKMSGEEGPSGAGGFQEAMAAKAFARPTVAVNPDSNDLESILAALAARSAGPSQPRFQ